jgi:hypothetical protein
MENQPPNIIAIGRKRFPIEDIALVEPFEPPAEQSPRFTSDKDFKARVVLIDRYNVLTEDTVEAFAEANKFRRLPDDNVATNPAVRFRVETFEPSEGFQPRKPYQSRLKWRDQDGNEQSKLLLTKPETVIAVVLRGEAAPAPDQQETPSEAPAPPPPRSRQVGAIGSPPFIPRPAFSSCALLPRVRHVAGLQQQLQPENKKRKNSHVRNPRRLQPHHRQDYRRSGAGHSTLAQAVERRPRRRQDHPPVAS